METNPVSMKQKVIFVAVLVAVFGGVATNFMGHKKPVVVAQRPTPSTTDVIASKAQAVKAAHDEKKNEQVKADADETAARGIKGNGTTNNVLKGVDTPTTISIDNLAITPAQADLLLYTAVSSGDVAQAKHLISEGIQVGFTDNALCMYDFTPMSQLPTNAVNLPTNTDEMTKQIAMQMANHRLDQKYLFVPSVCSKTFLYASVFHINKNDQRETFYYYHNDDSVNATKSQSISDVMKAKNEAAMDVEERKDQMFKYILSKTPAKDYAELPGIYLDPKLPFSIRQIALQKYLDNFGTSPSENVKKYRDLYKSTITDLVAKDPSDPHLAELESEMEHPFAAELKVLIDEYHMRLTAFGAQHDSIKEQMKFNTKMATRELPNISVADWDHDGMTYQENPNSALYTSDLNGKQAFKNIYELNGILKLINTIVNSDKFNMNEQDSDGNTILHYAVSNLNNDMTDRGIAVFVRYLLNKGADATLLNKKGVTALEMVMQRESSNNGNPDLIAPLEDVRKAFTDKDYK